MWSKQGPSGQRSGLYVLQKALAEIVASINEDSRSVGCGEMLTKLN